MTISGRLPPRFRKTSFKKLEYHSPLEGESERQGPSPPSIRRGANSPSR